MFPVPSGLTNASAIVTEAINGTAFVALQVIARRARPTRFTCTTLFLALSVNAVHVAHL